MLFILVACAANEVASEELVGVWHSDNFGMSGGMVANWVAIYITEDGNLYVFDTSFNPTGPSMTWIYHYHYELAGRHLKLTIVEGNDGAFDMEKVRISVRNNSIRLDMREANDWLNPREFLFTLYKVADEVPYGWTDEERQEARETDERIREEIFAFAQRFGNAIGHPVLPYDGNVPGGLLGIPFVIDDILIGIEFSGQSPMPRAAQRHHRISTSNVRSQNSLHIQRLAAPTAMWKEFWSANGQFTLSHDDWQGGTIPEEWLDIFAALDDSIDW